MSACSAIAVDAAAGIEDHLIAHDNGDNVDHGPAKLADTVEPDQATRIPNEATGRWTSQIGSQGDAKT
jgi:hypothetical protein